MHASPNKRSLALMIGMIGRLGVFPTLFYFVAFCVMTYPLIRVFNTHFFTDNGDGLLNVWNLWWVNKSITELGQLPWQTDYLHYPYGISLLGHTLNPFNGFLSIPLLRFLTLTQAHNVVILFSFVVGGLTAFFLAYYLTRAYWPSLIAGIIFSFSSYHFTHAEGHMNLVALEWIPLFVLSWYVLLAKPSLAKAIASAVTLFLVILCDYYYFLYTVLAAVFMLMWYAIRKRDLLFFLRKPYSAAMGVFLVGSAVMSGTLVVALLWLQLEDPLLASYVPEDFSLDLLAPFIPGGHWRFAELTKPYWSRLPGNIHESSMYLGFSVVFVLIYTAIRRQRAQMPSLGYWYFLLFFFALMSLGPVLHVWGREISSVKLPYALFFQKLFPPLRVARVPVRMMVMVFLSASVIGAAGFKLLCQQSTRTKALAAILTVIMAVEYWPTPIPTTQIEPPPYITLLKSLPGHEGVADMVTYPPIALYFQTIHEKPMAFGYVARVPASTEAKDQHLRAIIDAGQYPVLCREYGIRYLLTDATREVPRVDASIGVLYAGDGVRLYDLGAGATCEVAPATRRQ